MADYPEATHYTVHRDMIKKCALKRIIADERLDKMKSEIIQMIDSEIPVSIMQFYEKLGANGINFERAIKRWGLDIAEVKEKLENNRKRRVKLKRNQALSEYAEKVPLIVERLKKENPDTWLGICEELGVTSRFLHDAVQLQGYDSVAIVYESARRKRLKKKKQVAEASEKIKKNPLSMIWV